MRYETRHYGDDIPRDAHVRTYWREYGNGIQVLQVSQRDRPFSIARPVQAGAFLIYKNGELLRGEPVYTRFRDVDNRARFLASNWEANPMKSRGRSDRKGYGRRNPIPRNDWIIGGVVAAGIAGVVGYLIYKNGQATGAAAINAPLTVGQLTGAQPLPNTLAPGYQGQASGPAPAGSVNAPVTDPGSTMS